MRSYVDNGEDEENRLNVLVGTPAYEGKVTTTYLSHSIYGMMREKVPHSTIFVGNESLITRDRNKIISEFYHHRSFTHLFFLDGDVGLSGADIWRLLQAGRDVIGASVALKGTNDEGLPILNATLYDPAEESAPRALKRVKYLGTGALILTRKAVEALVLKARDERRIYNVHGTETPQYDIFRVGVVGDTYLSEDYWVCHELDQLGFSIWCDSAVKTIHQGMHLYDN